MTVTFRDPQLRGYWQWCVTQAFFAGPYDGATGSGWYTAYRELELVENRMTTTEWHMACASWRWMRDRSYLHPSDGIPAAISAGIHWEASKLIAAWRYQGVIPAPGKALAVRPTTEVVA